MRVGDFTTMGVFAFQTLVAMHFFGTEITRSIQRHQVVVTHETQAAQDFLPTQSLKHLFEHRSEVFGGDLIQNGPHLCVTGEAPDMIDPLQILRPFSPPIKGQQGRVF